MDGVELLLTAPHVAHRDCSDCILHAYHEEGADAGNPIIFNGRKVPRGRSKAPCQYVPSKCAKGTPDASKSLSVKNQRVFLHWRQCKSTGQWPDDPIVRRHAFLIECIYRKVGVQCDQ